MAAKHVLTLRSFNRNKLFMNNVIMRQYAIGLRKKAIKVYQSKLAKDIDALHQKKTQIAFAELPPKPTEDERHGMKIHRAVSTRTGDCQITYDVLGDAKYITKDVKKAQVSNSDANRNICLEGSKMINGAIKQGVEISKLYFNKVEHLESIDVDKLGDATKICKISTSKMDEISSFQSSRRFIALAKKPLVPIRTEGRMPMTLVLDRISSWTPMSVMLRAAAITGCQAVITTQGCVDPWIGHVINGAGGAHFSVPIIAGVQWDQLRNYLPQETDVLLARSADSIDGEEIDTSINRYPEIPRVPLLDMNIADKGHVTVIVSARFDDSPGAQQFVAASGGIDISLPSEDALVTSYTESAIGGIVLENARAQLRRTIETKKQMRTAETLDNSMAANDNEDESFAAKDNNDSTSTANDKNADLQAQYDVINQELRVQQENADRAERMAEAFRQKAKQDKRAAKEAEAAETEKTENTVSDNREFNQTGSRDIVGKHGKKVKNRKHRKEQSHNKEENLTDVVDEYRRQRAEFKSAKKGGLAVGGNEELFDERDIDVYDNDGDQDAFGYQDESDQLTHAKNFERIRQPNRSN